MAKGAYIGVNNVARKIKKGYVGIENFTKRNLPAGYTQVEYIQSSGTQYIDTGFKPNQDTRVVMDVEVTSGATSFLFGTRDNSSANDTSRSFSMPQISGTSLRSDYGSTEIAIAINPIQRLSIDKDKNSTKVNGTTATATAQTFQSSCNLCLLTVNTAGTINATKTSAKLFSCKIYDNGTLIRDYVSCTNSAGAAGLYDLVNGVFYTNAGTGTFAVGPTYKRIAHKIRKAYIGIGGVARPCWSGGELAYYGMVAELATPTYNRAAVTLENHALFAGGGIKNAYIFDKSLVMSSIPDLSGTRVYAFGARAGNYAIISGAYGYSSRLTTADVYSGDFTRSTITRSSEYQRAPGVSVPWGAVFTQLEGSSSGVATVIDENLTIKTSDYAYNLSTYYTKGAATKTRAIFAGEYGGYLAKSVNSDMTVTQMDNLSAYKQNSLTASFIGNAFFAGGSNTKPNTAVRQTSVDMYDDDLTHSTISPLSATKYGSPASEVDGGALEENLVFPGTTATETTDVYDQELVHTTLSLDVAIPGTSANVGNFLLFAHRKAALVFAFTE